MLVDKGREKLIHAIIFFTENTVYSGRTKLYKLLYFLDFLHYLEVGRPVTNVEYFAWPQGPVPRDLHQEWDGEPKRDFNLAFRRNRVRAGDFERYTLQPRIPFNNELFSKREKRIMADLARQHFRHTAEQMTEEAHLPSLPWDEVYTTQNRPQALIPYDLALDRKGDDHEVKELAKEHKEVQSNYEE